MKERLHYIQICRGLAAIAVLLYHLDVATKEYLNYVFFNFDYGYLGVDFFFVLSGFIITYIHLKDIQQKGVAKNFLIKRFIRIYPLYWLVLPLAIVLQSPDFKHKPELKYVLSTWDGVLKNIILFPQPISQMPVGVAWSMVYEVVFYLVFALCIVLGWKTTKVIFFSWTALILFSSRDIFIHTDITQHIFGNIVIEFLFGCVIGYLFLKGKELNGKWLLTSLLLIAGGFTVFLLTHEFNRYSIAVTTLIGLTSAIILFYAATLDKRKFKAPEIFKIIGDASYSIYLTHSLYTGYLCLGVAKVVNLSVIESWLLNAIIVIIFLVSLTIGVAIHYVVEKPLLRFFRNKLKIQPKVSHAAVSPAQQG
jgi:exopolysaccharide production protein ExoZ